MPDMIKILLQNIKCLPNVITALVLNYVGTIEARLQLLYKIYFVEVEARFNAIERGIETRYTEMDIEMLKTNTKAHIVANHGYYNCFVDPKLIYYASLGLETICSLPAPDMTIGEDHYKQKPHQRNFRIWNDRIGNDHCSHLAFTFHAAPLKPHRPPKPHEPLKHDEKRNRVPTQLAICKLIDRMLDFGLIDLITHLYLRDEMKFYDNDYKTNEVKIYEDRREKHLNLDDYEPWKRVREWRNKEEDKEIAELKQRLIEAKHDKTHNTPQEIANSIQLYNIHTTCIADLWRQRRKIARCQEFVFFIHDLLFITESEYENDIECFLQDDDEYTPISDCDGKRIFDLIIHDKNSNCFAQLHLDSVAEYCNGC